jgi:hypothetical protein
MCKKMIVLSVLLVTIVSSSSVVLAEKFFTEDGDLNKEYVKESVTKEIISQVTGSSGHRKRKSGHACRGSILTHGDIYLLPHWPYYTQFFQDNDLIQLVFSFDTASQSYSGHGGSQDLSKLIFGQQPILIKEILLVSKLLNQEKLTSQGEVGNPPNELTPAQSKADHYLGILANQKVVFNASFDQYNASIDYVRHFRGRDIAVGIHVPFKVKHQHLCLCNDICDENNHKLDNVVHGIDNETGQPLACLDQLYELQFYNKFNNLQDFVCEILCRKNINLNKKSSLAGIGDVVIYINLDIPTRYFERFITGLSLLLPTAQDGNTNKLWSTDLGNGGFVELALFGSWLWQHSRWLNPYVHMRGSYGFAANVNRRVPKINTYENQTFNGEALGAGNLPVDDRMIFGESLNFIDGRDFAEQDSTVRCFADQAIKVKIHPGASFFCRIGNTIDALFTYKGFLDIFYDLQVKGKDYTSGSRACDCSIFVPSILGHNTDTVTNNIGAAYSYQFDAQYRSYLSINYVFAGRNVPKTFGVELGLNAEF